MLTNRLHNYASREDGFTLVELLIVVLIIGVLAAIAIPVYLGIQNQAYKNSVKADVNTSVKRVQVAVTEGAAIADVKASYADYGVKASQPKNGETVYMANSPSAGASATRDYQIVGTMDKSATPNAAPINYTYTYDSYTGKFGEADTASSTPQIVLGSGTGSLPDGLTGSNYNAQIDATVTGGLGTTQYNVTAGSLPTGYSLDQSTGTISGNTSAAGTYPITVTVTNGSLTNNRAYVLRVYTKPAINTTTLPAGVVGSAYSQTLNFTGTPTPTFAVASGTLPAGLQLDTATGKITGNPTTTGTNTFTISATNGGGTATSSSLTITVNSAPAFTTTTLPDGTVSSAYNQTIVTTGSPAPTYTATGLPGSLTIDPNTGAITGTPTATDGAKTYNVTVTATNSVTSTNQAYTLNIASVKPTITTSILDNYSVGSNTSQTLNANNVSGTPVWAVASGSSLPAGLTLNTATGAVSGNPSTFGAWTVNFTVTGGGKTSDPTPVKIGATQNWTITNAGAEDTSNPSYTWSDYCGGNITWSTTAHTGSRSYRNDTVNGNCSEGVLAWIHGTFPSGTKVSMSAWVSGTNGITWTVGGRTNPYNEGFVDNRIVTTGIGNWQQVNATFNAYSQQGGTMTDLGLQVHQIVSPSVSGNSILIDDLTAVVGGW